MFFLADPAHGVEPFLIPADSQAASVNYGMIITLLRRPSRYVAASRLPLAAHNGLHIMTCTLLIAYGPAVAKRPLRRVRQDLIHKSRGVNRFIFLFYFHEFMVFPGGLSARGARIWRESAICG
jgi:hypothetical protein